MVSLSTTTWATVGLFVLEIVEFIEKPTEPISNLAIVGIYYFKEASYLAESIKNILENKIIINGEYQITTALEKLKNKNHKFSPHKITDWFDFGTPNNLLASHAQILNREPSKSRKFENSTIIEPCYIGPGVTIINSTIGPNVSISEGTSVKNSTIKNSIIQSDTKINGAELQNSIIGKHVEYNKGFKELNVGDYSVFK